MTKYIVEECREVWGEEGTKQLSHGSELQIASICGHTKGSVSAKLR